MSLTIVLRWFLNTIVHDKNGIDDPHDNPSISIDKDGYIWVFVSGRGSKRMGYKYKSTLPYDINSFEKVTEEEMTYPQIFQINEGFFHSFTKYTGVRQLYFETSIDGSNWTDDQLLAAIPQNEGEESGHYQISNGHKPGPVSAPYQWISVSWTGKKWETTVITTSDHNYNMGSLYTLGKEWKVVGPTELGPQEWGLGGELAIWTSRNKGKNWMQEKTITSNSEMSHAYVRRPVNFKAPFCYFWASGHSHRFSKSQLHLGDFEGNVWVLPYDMKADYEMPLKLK